MHIWADIQTSHSNTFLWDVSRKTWAAKSIVICCSVSSSDVTNILVGCREQQFPPNWKAHRPFRCWCYLAAVFPSWPSMKDEPLYISSLSLWIEPKLHHHSNGCLAYTPRDIVIPQIAWKQEIVYVAADFEALKLCLCVCVCVDVILSSVWCRLHLSVWIIDQSDHGILWWRLKSLPVTHLSPLFLATSNNFQTTCSIITCWDDRMLWFPNKILLCCDSSGTLPSCFVLNV